MVLRKNIKEKGRLCCRDPTIFKEFTEQVILTILINWKKPISRKGISLSNYIVIYRLIDSFQKNQNQRSKRNIVNHKEDQRNKVIYEERSMKLSLIFMILYNI